MVRGDGTNGGDSQLDLRALTRESVRGRIAETAWDVFAERGFDEVTATEVAEAAGISRASFFRYFSSKEEAVFAALEALGAQIASALAERPAGEDAWTALRRAFDGAIPNYATNPARSLARLRLTREVPALRAHQLERQDRWQAMIAEVLAPRIGAEPDDVRVRALVTAAINALDAATARWASSDGKLNLVALIDEAFDAVGGPKPKPKLS
jgi:AcrR family transcriptional regulator